MAKALDELGDDDYFINQFGDRADTHARFSYYPPCARPDLVFGLRPHSDGTFLSLLMLDDSVGGLQVFRDGVWYDVRTRPHTLLVNLGDQIEVIHLLTNYHYNLCYDCKWEIKVWLIKC
jgi:isopenicillin N synthase-like dioxygenase